MNKNNSVPERTTLIYNYIKEHPGSTSSEIGKALGINYRVVANALPSLDLHGYMVYQDEYNRLFLCDETS